MSRGREEEEENDEEDNKISADERKQRGRETLFFKLYKIKRPLDYVKSS